MRNRVVYAIALVAVILLFTGCGSPQEKVAQMAADPVSEELMTKALDAIQNNDSEGFRALFVEGSLPAGKDFSDQFAQIRAYYHGNVLSFEAKSKNTYTNQNAGSQKIVKSVYEVDTDADKYLVSLTRVETGGQSRLGAFNIVLSDEYTAAVTPTGYLSDIARFTAPQWILLVLNVLVYGFIVWTIIRCVRDRIRYKPLFVIISILQAALTFAVSPGSFHVNFSITPAGFASQLLYPNGAIVTTVLIPLGAFIYWGVRKGLIRRALLARGRTPADSTGGVAIENKANDPISNDEGDRGDRGDRSDRGEGAVDSANANTQGQDS